MPTGSARQPWRRVDAGFVLHTWADEGTANAYDPRSGQTHALSTLSMALLDLLDAGPQTADELASQLADVFDDSTDACTCVHGELSRLRRIGIVDTPG